MAFNSTSTYTLQNEVDKVRTFPLLLPIFDVGGYSSEPAVSAATDVMTAILSLNFPHKWNEIQLPLFYSNSWQQDYALINPDSTSVLNVEWLERGVAFNINANSASKPSVNIECGRQLPQRTAASGFGASQFAISSFPNYSLYYGQWGQTNVGNKTLGNNPVAQSIYTTPLGNYSMPSNPITQIIDANGNYLVLTTYGHEGSAAPLAAVNAVPGVTAVGTGATTIWTVVDPNGLGIRLQNIPAQTGVVWQFNITGQKPLVPFTSLGQTLAPLPDKYESFFRAGLITQLYRYSPETKIRAMFQDEFKMWMRSLQNMRETQDRELEENSFKPERTIMGGYSRSGYQGAANPY
jgi:hypothetical protein